jgi:tetratricopeptide (TPR) repeat protein
MSRFAVMAVALTCLVGGFAVPAWGEEPQVSRELAKPLKAVQDALNSKQYADAIAKAKEANAIPGKSAYDQFIINEFLLSAYANQNSFAEAASYIETNQSSPYIAANVRQQRVRTLMALFYQLRNYAKVTEFGAQARANGDNSADTLQLIANSNYLLGKYKEAMATMQEILNRADDSGGKPDEKQLKFVWDCANRLNDNATASRVVEKLVTYYPKPDYWQYAMVSLMQSKGNDDRLSLNIYRLMNDVGILQRSSDYTDAAQIALDQGNPGEAYSLLQAAFAKNVYTEQRDKDRNQRLLDSAKAKAAVDRAGIAKYEADAARLATGDGLVQIGAAYLGFGQPDKATAAISKGIAKGSLKYADEAYLLLGISHLRQKNMDDARRAFGKVPSDSKYTRLAKLWALRARG